MKAQSRDASSVPTQLWLSLQLLFLLLGYFLFTSHGFFLLLLRLLFHHIFSFYRTGIQYDIFALCFSFCQRTYPIPSFHFYFLFFLVPWTIVFYQWNIFDDLTIFLFITRIFFATIHDFSFFIAGIPRSRFSQFLKLFFSNLYFNNCSNNEEISRLIKSLVFASQLNELLIGVYYMQIISLIFLPHLFSSFRSNMK